MFENLVSLENLFACWQEYRKGKNGEPDVQRFERHLEDNIFALHGELRDQTYRHKPYSTFHIYDPKHRVISKATVRDRLVHHAVFNELYKLFNPGFIYHSYSSRLERGTHLAVNNLSKSLRKVSRNYTRPVFALKCDIKKFFASVSHGKLLQIIESKIQDRRFLQLFREIVGSFSSTVDNHEQRERERAYRNPHRQSNLTNFCQHISERIRSICKTPALRQTLFSIR
ncbi:MAG: hypothetical protein A3C85_03825 [Candidatus Doudnabacteria bacterium RIFCSPHIGHO2_02_FULL_48_21]|uniref:Uncharacterized protein n=1 Tax=Candidatus Doudnabacteria bacterium RIFCSPLOWO2_02_FULL_48_13 TaxID=1817845 RepID=A0A1F5QBT8_9BACT|nr:MAG: hypothetical protein A3K05_03320 [Candidatus Doudnabacteria bacterium RIFCSPHIGHO2_01_48_18]OGE77166.1 MAG: hypothetical protein A2668_01640 [Candidatus Doudnabacteria bacterium RIFCSPHIGHO2_01_FULL_48_180]OGE91771.1 MAG: hypothetical protein A3F44_00165 [Candidatus Doudnabacteria bacterium RIFCSPHIGHO2_12_FULL_47_25]OGE93584.1 MAG: hypothetical protein A3C85_03825 [Candidatus Doudnabacteria bacterium RIFCSPHIGHO2_02_FULL_48_21]OGE96518.1 MAG: hypothetical protein A3A83_04295 [Candidatu